MALLEADAPVLDVEQVEVPKGYELVDGELQEKPSMSAEASWVASRLHFQLSLHLETHPIGTAVTAEFTYSCFPDFARLVRKPDVSVILCDPKTYVPPRVNSTVPPALMVEVLSPGNNLSEIEDKIEKFFDAGTRLAWVIDPARRVAYVQRAANRDQLQRIRDTGTLDGEDVLPGFKLPLALVLPPKA